MNSVNHSVGEHVRGMAHTDGMESFWARAQARLSGAPTTI